MMGDFVRMLVLRLNSGSPVQQWAEQLGLADNTGAAWITVGQGRPVNL